MSLRSLGRRLRRTIWNLTALLVIVAGVAAGLLQLGLPWLVRNPERVELWLSDRLHRPVKIGQVTAGWMKGGPQLALDEVTIGGLNTADEGLTLGRAELALNIWAPFQRNGVWNEFSLVGADLNLSRTADGRWQLRGLELPSSPANRGDGFGALGALVLKDLRLHIDDPQRALKLDLVASELRLINRNDGLRIVGRVQRRDSAELSAPLSLVIDSSPDGHSGHAWLGGANLDFAELLRGYAVGGIALDGGNGQLDLWADWNESGPTQLSAGFDLRELNLRRVDAAAESPATRLAAVSGVARLQRKGDDWNLDIADWSLSPVAGKASAPARVTIAKQGSPAQWTAVADRIDITGLASLAALAPAMSDGLRQWLDSASPQGVISHPQLRYKAADDYQIAASFDGLAVSSVGRAPALLSLRGSLLGDNQSLLLNLPIQPLTLEFPGVLRTPLNYSQLGGDLVAWKDDDGWHVETDALSFMGEGYGGLLRGGASFSPDRKTPSLDVRVAIENTDVVAAKLFWPINIMRPPAVQWLDRGLVGGKLQANAVFRGNLGDWPFRGNEGHFDGLAELEGLNLLFDPAWPQAEDVRATARFVNGGLTADVASGRAMGLSINSARASIPVLGHVVLDLEAKGQGKGGDLLAYLRATPIGRNHAAGLEGLTVGGSGDIDFRMHLPVGHPDQMTLAGDIRLRAAPLASSQWDVQLDGATGLLQFDQKGLVGKDIAVQHAGKPGTLGVAIGAPVSDAANALEMNLGLSLEVQQLLDRAPGAAFLKPYLSGVSPWNIALLVPKAESDQRPRLQLTSSLAGTRVSLPAPIGKNADSQRALKLSLPLPVDGETYRLDYGDVLTHVGRIAKPGQNYAARLDLGTEVAGPMPQQGIDVGGRAAELDAGGWIAFAVGMAGNGGGSGLRALDLHAGQLLIGDSRLGDVDVSMDFRNGTKVTLAGSSVQGTIDLPTDLVRAGVTVHLPKMHWPQPPESAPHQDDADDTRSPFAPSSAPPMHIWIGDLRVGNAQFGETRIETRPTATGMRIDTLDARSSMLHMTASGDWNGSADTSETELDLELSAPDLGKVLDGFGFKGVIDGGPTEASLSGRWPGSPAAFALSRLAGTLNLEVGQGRFLEVNPGAGGRLFGLLSLGEIRRRLALDFTDFYKSGTTFNEISGRFDLDGSVAHTKGLSIDSPAAEIVISGRTGLKARDYDQQMVVTPKAGVALPVVGAIAGGPVGAAAGFVVQNLFNKQIGAAARSRYSVKGSWDKPEIELIERDDAVRDAAPSSK